jgi:4'-phosphopantetheinyl transferase EntD
MISTILPWPVFSRECFDDPPNIFLFDSEQAVVASAVAKRRLEFGTVRHCARQALAVLGYPPVPLLPGRRGAPRWPDGVVGSMTHCAGYRAAAVAAAAQVRAVGIDAEPDAPLPDGVLALIARPEEVARLAELAAVPAGPGRPVCWGRLLFSCKEAVFKAWYPVTGRELDFTEVSIVFEPRRRTFTARLLPQAPAAEDPMPPALAGRWTTDQSLLVSATTLLRTPPLAPTPSSFAPSSKPGLNEAD